MEEARTSLEEILSRQSRLCNFTHTDEGGKRCPRTEFGCLHSESGGPIPAMLALYRHEIISLCEYLELTGEYFGFNKAFKEMDLLLHVNAQVGNDTERLKERASGKRGAIFAFVRKVLDILVHAETVNDNGASTVTEPLV